MTKVNAIYENGVLRPTERLPLKNGETVELTIESKPVATGLNDIDERIRTARSLQEWVDATKLLPDDDGGYDILKALDANRRWAGERPILPDSEDYP